VIVKLLFETEKKLNITLIQEYDHSSLVLRCVYMYAYTFFFPRKCFEPSTIVNANQNLLKKRQKI
jgi:hypothetical protein